MIQRKEALRVKTTSPVIEQKAAILFSSPFNLLPSPTASVTGSWGRLLTANRGGTKDTLLKLH